MNFRKPIPFGEWLPDQPALMNPGALIAKNVIPQLKSYRSFNSLSSFSDALTGACLGHVWAKDDNGAVNNFAGDVAKLYRLTGGNTWTDVSGATYTADNWDFTKYGDRIIAVNSADNPQKFDMTTDSAFADLTNAPPAARVATVRDFVMLGDIPSLGPDYIQWSGYNNSEFWTSSIARQSDFQKLHGKGGRVQRIVPGEYAVILSEQSLNIATYVGPRPIFQIDEVENARGTPAPNSVVWTGQRVFYYGWDDFYMFDGQQSYNLGANKVARWFRQNAAQDAMSSMRGAIDRANRLIMWAFKSSASNTLNNRIIVYNWVNKRWAYAEIDTEILLEFVSPGYTLDDLDTIFADIDGDSIPVDSDLYTGGSLNVGGFDSSHQAGTFDGAALTAVLETAEIASNDQSTVYVDAIRPLVETTSAPNITVSVGHRNLLSENTAYTTPPRSLNPYNGEANIRRESRYQRYRVTIDNTFSHATGVKVSVQETGGHR